MSVEQQHEFTPVNSELADDSAVQYELLTGHTRTDGSFKTTEQLHTEYIRLTDELVRRVTEDDIDTIVWLDKSARPVSWLMRDLWPVLAPDNDGNVPEQPQSRYVNIDRNQWISDIDPQGKGISNIGAINPSIIRSLRSIFLANPQDRGDHLNEAIDNAPTQFDGKRVLIVDEVVSSGRTLNYATNFFERAFPEAEIVGTHWMGKVTTQRMGKTTAVGNADLPVWYTDKTVLGRGIGNRNIDLSLTSENAAQRLGAYFLSTALRTPDPLSIQLRHELHQLAEDARDGKVFIEPSLYRDEPDYDERALRLNHLTDIDEYFAQKRQHDAVRTP